MCIRFLCIMWHFPLFLTKLDVYLCHLLPLFLILLKVYTATDQTHSCSAERVLALKCGLFLLKNPNRTKQKPNQKHAKWQR